MQCPECSDRVRRIRAYYMEHAEVPLQATFGFGSRWVRYQEIKGWLANEDAETFRLRRARTQRYLLEHIEPVIYPEELIVGQPSAKPFTAEEEAEFLQLEQNWNHYVPQRRGRPDHMGLDYEKLLRVGVCGLIEEIHTADDALDLFIGEDLVKHEYYMCCLEELEGMLNLERRYAQHARELAKADPIHTKELLELAEVLDVVPAYPAQTFRQALQSVHLYTASLWGIYSAGRPDQYLYPYFQRDMAEGRLTLEKAQELIDCFCLQYMANMASWAAAGFEVCGYTRDGQPVENELSWMFIASVAHTHSADPSIGLCVNPHTSRELVKFAAQIIADGHTSVAYWNDEGIIQAMVERGYRPEDARWWTHSTCVEITPIAKSGVSITSPYVNTLKVFLAAMDEATDETSFEELVELFAKHMQEHMRREIVNENLWQIERERNCTDPFMTSCLVDGCIQSGKSHDSGGAPYNFLEPNLLGMMNVTESLNVVHQLVYAEKRLSISAFRKILSEDYANDEVLRQYIIRRIVHFGNNEPFSDALAKRVADICMNACRPLKTYRGADVIPGAFAYREHAIQGRTTPASPDGRKAGMPLTGGSDPVQGYDTSGPTASLLSTTEWQTARFLGGVAVNLKLASSTPNLPDVIAALVDIYVERGGSELQITVTNAETLKKAQENPEAYGDLLVRIGGYSDFFVRIDKDIQDEIIRRSCM